MSGREGGLFALLSSPAPAPTLEYLTFRRHACSDCRTNSAGLRTPKIDSFADVVIVYGVVFRSIGEIMALIVSAVIVSVFFSKGLRMKLGWDGVQTAEYEALSQSPPTLPLLPSDRVS